MEICQQELPIKPWMEAKTRRLPGIQPVKAGEWLLRDDAFAAQMAYRDHLISTRLTDVFRATADSLPAQEELLETVLSELDAGYERGGAVTRPDGISVSLTGPPLLTAARLVQEDLLIMDMAAEPRLTAAALCFPASWSLDEKFGAGLMAIHGYMDEYTDEMAARVRRMFDAIRPEQPLWRANFLRYAKADLHQPLRNGEDKPAPKSDGFVRVERQTLRKLPRTGAVVFGIHTYVIRWDQLRESEQFAFTEASA
ncbi:MAG: DUF3445 domain-containing protein [Rhodobacteraceae bacterium]|nr:DUF3445 domain-containing protein [Paracoccaceae bacterium]